MPARPHLGILVTGDNHFIVRGPQPDRATAIELAAHWSIIVIGKTTPSKLSRWTISTKEFRENLEWAVVASAETAHSPAVEQLLHELEVRGIQVLHTNRDHW